MYMPDFDEKNFRCHIEPFEGFKRYPPSISNLYKMANDLKPVSYRLVKDLVRFADRCYLTLPLKQFNLKI